MKVLTFPSKYPVHPYTILVRNKTVQEERLNTRYRCFRLLPVLAALVLAACGEDNVAPDDGAKATALRDYLIASNMDLPDLLTDWIIRADDLHGNEVAYQILDIRDKVVYDAGHIPSAVHSSLGGILADAAGSNGRPIVVVCYTGQIAGHAVMALRLSGYPDAKVLEFGMSSWNSDFDSWTANCRDVAAGHENWIVPPGSIVIGGEYGYPSISAGSSDGAGILAERVAAMLKGGFRGINAVDVLDTPGGYFINDFWAEADVTEYGNIEGARRICPMSLESGEIRGLDPGARIVTYCWTGQTSSMITAYLTVLGYDAVSLKFGANGMIYSDLVSNKWVGSFSFSYEATVPLDRAGQRQFRGDSEFVIAP
jgi:rhodanese-related sulfurtransferase